MNRKKLLLAMFGGLLLVLCVALLTILMTFRSSEGPPKGRLIGSYGPESLDVYGLIREGDLAYGAYRYDEAYSAYHEAERSLLSQIEFESDSPSRDLVRLQHYHNTKVLLRARIELALLAQEITRPDHVPRQPSTFRHPSLTSGNPSPASDRPRR